jgi:hypothetical protein
LLRLKDSRAVCFGEGLSVLLEPALPASTGTEVSQRQDGCLGCGLIGCCEANDGDFRQGNLSCQKRKRDDACGSYRAGSSRRHG